MSQHLLYFLNYEDIFGLEKWLDNDDAGLKNNNQLQVKLDKAIYGKIKGVTDREYYTNSFHVPVYYKTAVEHKIKTEAPYHALTNAGHISYIELDGDTTENVEAFEKVKKWAWEQGQ